MWILYAIGSAFFAGVTSILAKIGIQQTDSNVATAIRTVVVLVFSWFMVFIVGSFQTISEISLKTLLFLILSGLATGGSWLCYFKALQLGDVNKVTPIDKSSTVLTMILAFIFLGERLSITKLLGMIGIGVGTYLMIMKKEDIQKEVSNSRWMFYAILSAILASLTAILGKVGIIGVESNLGTAIRTIVVLIMAWIIVFVTHKQHEVKHIDSKSWITTGLSWLCYYKALQEGDASLVVPIDKLSILVTIGFSYMFLKEKLTKKSASGLVIMVGGTFILLI